MGWAASSGNALLITTSSIYFYQRDVFLLGLFDALCLSARLLKKLWMNLNISGKERTWHKKQSIRSWVRGEGGNLDSDPGICLHFLLHWEGTIYDARCSTCAQKLTDSHLSLSYGTKQTSENKI